MATDDYRAFGVFTGTLRIENPSWARGNRWSGHIERLYDAALDFRRANDSWRWVARRLV